MMSSLMVRWSLAAGFLAAVASSPLQAVPLLSEDFTGGAGTQPTGFGAFTTGGMVSQNDGSGEYEQRNASGNGVALAAYQVSDEVLKGAWRDATVTTKTRYSGGADNLNGPIVRASDISAGSGTGDFYHARVNGNNLQLYRTIGGAFTLLDTQPVAGGLGSIINRYWRVSTRNISQPDQDHVHISAELATDDAFSNVIGSIDFTDTSADAITRAGGVGYRTNNSAGGTRAVFDDLAVEGNNNKLLFYDDYYDGSAPKMETFGTSGVVSNEKFQFDHNSGGDISLGLVDFDSFTSMSHWENVEASALLRLNTNGATGSLAPGLLLRETGIVNSSSGGPGSYYMFRVNRVESNNTYTAELFRKNGASGFTPLVSVPLSDDLIPESENIYIKFSAVNEGPDVRLQGMLSLNANFSDPYGVINYLDTSSSALFGPGSAGFRVFGEGAVNFDNFTVTHVIPEPMTATLAMLGVAALAARRRRA